MLGTNQFYEQGITIKPLVEFLKVKREEKWEKTMNERLHEKVYFYLILFVNKFVPLVDCFL